MNKLSWLLYAADVFGNLKLALGMMGTFGLIGSVCWYVISCSEDDIGPSKPPGYLIPMFVMMLLAASVVPSTDTVYLIAGSEASEIAVKSEIGQKVLAGVEKAIDSYAKKAGQ